jgi:hypothetical protein
MVMTMATRRSVQRFTLATLALLALTMPAAALREEPSYSALFDTADLVVIATPVGRSVLGEHASLRL